MDRFLCVQAFVRVAQRRSFAEAARQLGVAPSVVTNRVRKLEEYVKAPLFHRSTRNVSLSEAGKSYFEECVALIDRFEVVTDQMRVRHENPSGLLRLHVLPEFALGHLSCALNEFRDAHPSIDLDVTVSDLPVNPVDEGFDISLQMFAPTAEVLIERPLFPIRQVFCASPAYLRKHGEPHEPKELLRHTLCVYSAYPARKRWNFIHRDGEEISLDLPASIRSNSVHLLRDFARSGGAITCVPTLVCAEDLAEGSLVPLLADYQLPPLDLLAIYPETLRRAVKVRLFLDFITQRFSGEAEWVRRWAQTDQERVAKETA
jgi:DNA-binding transcriptional LysR family regulator